MTAVYLVSAVYADVIDEPQVYETSVEANDVPEAERLARERAVVDNGGTVGEDDETFALTDVFARLAPTCPHCGRQVVEADPPTEEAPA